MPQDSVSNVLNLQVNRQSFNLFGPCRLSMLLVSQAVVLLAWYIAASSKDLADKIPPTVDTEERTGACWTFQDYQILHGRPSAAPRCSTMQHQVNLLAVVHLCCVPQWSRF